MKIFDKQFKPGDLVVEYTYGNPNRPNLGIVLEKDGHLCYIVKWITGDWIYGEFSRGIGITSEHYLRIELIDE